MDALLRYRGRAIFANCRPRRTLRDSVAGDVLQVPAFWKSTMLRKRARRQQDARRGGERHILATLKTHAGSCRTAWAAYRLGVKRSTLQFRMKKLGIERPREVDEATHEVTVDGMTARHPLLYIDDHTLVREGVAALN